MKRKMNTALCTLAICFSLSAVLAGIATAQNWKKLDTTKYFHFSNSKLYFDTLYNPKNSEVCKIDTANNVTVPSGWEYILVIKNKECWAFDSSRANRNLSQPQFRRAMSR
jgi:hypothetical protein